MVTVFQDSIYNELSGSCDDSSSKTRENLEKCFSTDEFYRDLANNKIDRDFTDTLYIKRNA
jgi:hypothetical protein